jgi:hypothetical protein
MRVTVKDQLRKTGSLHPNGLATVGHGFVGVGEAKYLAEYLLYFVTRVDALQGILPQTVAQAQHNHPSDIVEGDCGAAFVGSDGLGGAVGDNVAP